MHDLIILNIHTAFSELGNNIKKLLILIILGEENEKFWHLPELHAKRKLLQFIWRRQVEPMALVAKAERPRDSTIAY